jgi:hypothetical protein
MTAATGYLLRAMACSCTDGASPLDVSAGRADPALRVYGVNTVRSAGCFTSFRVVIFRLSHDGLAGFSGQQRTSVATGILARRLRCHGVVVAQKSLRVFMTASPASRWG